MKITIQRILKFKHLNNLQNFINHNAGFKHFMELLKYFICFENILYIFLTLKYKLFDIFYVKF